MLVYEGCNCSQCNKNRKILAKQEEKANHEKAEKQKKLDKEKWQGNPSEFFYLGWCQVQSTVDRDAFFSDYLFTSNTKNADKQRIISLNDHLNNPLLKGEIVVITKGTPTNEKEKSALDTLLEEAKAASEALAKLTTEEIDTLHRHFLLFDEYLSELLLESKIKGMPTDNFAHSSAAIGAISTGAISHLESIQTIIQEIDTLYVQQVAMASRTGGGINYPHFITERARLFTKLDNTFSRITFNALKIPEYSRLRTSLGLSTKSIIHNADEIVKGKSVPTLGKKIANVARAIEGAKTLGYVGIIVGAMGAGKNIIDACTENDKDKCVKTSIVETLSFGASIYSGAISAKFSGVITGAILLFLGVSSAPIVGVAVATGAITGGIFGGIYIGGFTKISLERLYVSTSNSTKRDSQ